MTTKWRCSSIKMFGFKLILMEISFISAFIGAYLLYDWAEAENARLSRKNPADYANDK